MESIYYKEAYKKAEEIDKTLKCSDFGPIEVEIMMEDGSHFVYDSSFTRWIDGDWIAIFAEHYPFSVHNKDDIYWCKERYKYETDKAPKTIYIRG